MRLRVRQVDLPQPVGPTTAQTWPAGTSRSRFWTAEWTVPSGVGNLNVVEVDGGAAHGGPCGAWRPEHEVPFPLNRRLWRLSRKVEEPSEAVNLVPLNR
jgi:hypothetical protein